jgi:TetR/AcrR family transcriptional regulator, regulator of cefoperazone and chloramphenicol sensitivity
MADPKAALIRAGEHLFARVGIAQTRVRELNAMAGQRNASALHYHFGDRQGLLRAIYERHSAVIDADRAQRLSRLAPDASVHDIVAVILAPMADHLARSDGRDYLRILAQRLIGEVEPPAIVAAFTLARDRLADLGVPDPLRDERLLGMLRAATTLLAERARALEDGEPLALDAPAFAANLVDMATGMLTAPTRHCTVSAATATASVEDNEDRSRRLARTERRTPAG